MYKIQWFSIANLMIYWIANNRFLMKIKIKILCPIVKASILNYVELLILKKYVLSFQTCYFSQTRSDKVLFYSILICFFRIQIDIKCTFKMFFENGNVNVLIIKHVICQQTKITILWALTIPFSLILIRLIIFLQ